MKELDQSQAVAQNSARKAMELMGFQNPGDLPVNIGDLEAVADTDRVSLTYKIDDNPNQTTEITISLGRIKEGWKPLSIRPTASTLPLFSLGRIKEGWKPLVGWTTDSSTGEKVVLDFDKEGNPRKRK